MKISIENFKSITRLHNFEIKPFTILSGVNSAGKSSFVQLLLILKQTIELDSSKKAFLLDGEFYKVKGFSDVISQKDIKRKLKVSFNFNKSEIEEFTNLKILSNLKTYECVIDVQYDITENNDAFVSIFSVNISLEEGKPQSITLKTNKDRTYTIDTNTLIFGKGLYTGEPINIIDISYSSFYPVSYESQEEAKTEYATEKAISKNKELLNFDDIKILINSFLENISYIGPNRESPKDEYSVSSGFITVGTKGEFTAQILKDESEKIIDYYKIENTDDVIVYKVNKEKTLLDAVNYWMCTIFDVAENIRSEKTYETYKIILTNKSGLETSIKHVGFGMSQLLPVIVEGLRMPINGTLIIEQPEIHLHPKLQSKLYDFLYSLTKQGKKVIVETHSSHFITRMRRRIAEDETNEMDDQIGLTFIEGNIFRSIELDDYGTMDYYPEDFIEASNSELRAIVKAQMLKRKKNG